MLKHLTILGWLLAAMAVMPPMPGKTAARPGDGSSNANCNSQNKDGVSPPQVTVNDQPSAPIDTKHAEEVTAKESEHSVTLTSVPPLTINSKKKVLLDYVYDWGPWFFGLFLAIAGGIQLKLLGVTWKAIQEQKTEMAIQTGVLKESVAAAKKAADAAEISANAAIGVAVPTLVLSTFVFGPETDYNYRYFMEPTAQIVYKNCGQSPALLKAYTITFTWEELPATPKYDFPYPLSTEDVIDAGKTYTIDWDSSLANQKIPLQTAYDLESGKKTLIAYGYISYGDIFGSPLKYMKFCKRLMEVGSREPFVMDHGGYDYTGQHENYDGPSQKRPKPN